MEFDSLPLSPTLLPPYPGDPRETLLHQIVSGSEDSVGGGGAKEGEGRALVEYYIKVMRLFEQIPAPTFVVSTATVATKVASKTDPNSVSIQRYCTSV